MRLSAAASALLIARVSKTWAAADTEPLSRRRHLLYQKHRLFPHKLRLDDRNNGSGDSSITHKKKSKMGDDWYELDEVQPLVEVFVEVETAETRGDEKQVVVNESENVTATDKTVPYSTEEACIEANRRHLAKQGKESKVKSTTSSWSKAGKDSNVKSTTIPTWVATSDSSWTASKKSSKGGKRAKTKSSKRSKSSTIKCHTVPPKPSGKPTVKPTQELPSGTPLPTPSPTEATTEPSSTSTVVTEAPVTSIATDSPTSSSSDSAKATESPSASAMTVSPSDLPSVSTVVTDSPTTSTITESPTNSTDVTESPSAAGTTEFPSGSPSASTAVTDSPTTSPTSVPGTSDLTKAPTATGATESPTNSSVTEAPTTFNTTEFATSSPSVSGSSGLTEEAPTLFPSIQPSSQAVVTEAPVTTVNTESPVSTKEKCSFCVDGLTDPEAEAPDTGGQTCAQVELLASSDNEGSATCEVIQAVESFCCPPTPGDSCSFCEDGLTDPDAVPPDTGGQTCAQIQELAADDNEGSDTCTTIQAVESICCPQIQSCAPLDPNPYTFEPPNNVFPNAPWTTGGDGVWAIDDTNAQEGTYSIKSPNLEGSEGTAVSNATLAICDDFAGGVLTFSVLAPVIPPYDVLVWFVDGVETSQLAGQPDWNTIPISLTPGAHRIDFQYQYNPFNLPELPPDPLPIRQGAVWIDTVALQNM